MRQVKSREIVTISLTARQSALLRDLILENLDIASAALPEQVARARLVFDEFLYQSNMRPSLGVLASQAARRAGLSAVYIDGLPTDFGDAQTDAMTVLGLVVFSRLGQPFNYIEQSPSEIVSPLTPKPGGARNSNSSPGQFLDHSDDRIVPEAFRVRAIALFGESNPSGARTSFTPVDRIVAGLSEATVEILRRPLYRFKRPTSFSLDSVPEWSEPMPILYSTSDGLMGVQCADYGVKSLTAQARDAYAQFMEICRDIKTWLLIDAGTAMFFYNDRGLHSREAIADVATGPQRRIYRIYWRENLQALEEHAATELPHVYSLAKIFGGGS